MRLSLSKRVFTSGQFAILESVVFVVGFFCFFFIIFVFIFPYISDTNSMERYIAALVSVTFLISDRVPKVLLGRSTINS